MRRLASPDDIAAAVAFLAGPGSSAIVGQILRPSGGVTRDPSRTRAIMDGRFACLGT